MPNFRMLSVAPPPVVDAKSPDRPEYDKRRDRIAARCMKYGNADRIRAWEGKLSKHGEKNAVKSPAGALYSELRLRDDIVERDRVALLKPLRQKTKTHRRRRG